MDDTPNNQRRGGWEPPMPSEAELLAELDRSDADVDAGRIVSGDEVLREIDEAIARMEAKREASRRTAARR